MEKNKDFDAIMKEITGGLSGDSQTDMSYLREQMEKYKDHEMSKEIIRACGRLMYELIPDDKKEELAKIISNDSAGTESALEEVRFNIYKKDFNKALRIMEALVKKSRGSSCVRR
jgi:Tfp pilus assembly pilus retraction ATPase PilT